MASRVVSVFRKFPMTCALGLTTCCGCKQGNDLDKTPPDAVPTQVAPNASALVSSVKSPDIPGPAFHVTYQDNSIVTIVVQPSTSIPQLENLVWQLRTAAHEHTFNTLKISQTLVDERAPSTWFEIYRGDRCASENHVKGRPSCGLKQHEAATYLYGNFADWEGDSAVVYHGEAESQPEMLWGPDHPVPSTLAQLLQTHRQVEESPQDASDAKTTLLVLFSKNVWAGGRKANFSVGSNPTEMIATADWLASRDNQRLLQLGMTSHVAEVCAAGFKRVRMVPFQNDMGSSFEPKCK